MGNLLVASNGVCVLQTGDIDLAFTESMEEARQAQAELTGSQTVPYNTQYTVSFQFMTERFLFMAELTGFLGKHLTNFLIEDRGDSITLAGFCII